MKRNLELKRLILKHEKKKTFSNIREKGALKHVSKPKNLREKEVELQNIKEKIKVK